MKGLLQALNLSTAVNFDNAKVLDSFVASLSVEPWAGLSRDSNRISFEISEILELSPIILKRTLHLFHRILSENFYGTVSKIYGAKLAEKQWYSILPIVFFLCFIVGWSQLEWLGACRVEPSQPRIITSRAELRRDGTTLGGSIRGIPRRLVRRSIEVREKRDPHQEVTAQDFALRCKDERKTVLRFWPFDIGD